MASVRLGRQQAETGDLPAVCMRCGQPTEMWIPRQFSARKDYLERRMLVLVPACDRHRNRWRTRVRVNWGTLACLILIMGVLIASPVAFQMPLWIFLGVGAVSWLIFNIIYGQLLIRATEITDHTINLQGVSKEFIEALERKKTADRQRREGIAIPQKLRQIQGKLIDARIRRREVEEDSLPQTCMRCGAPAEVRQERKFKWHPEWIGTLMIFGLLCFMPLAVVGLILSIVMTKSVTVAVPLCHVHRRHWVWRNVVGITGLIVLPMIGAAGIICIGQAQARNDAWETLGGIMLGGTLLGFFIWLFAMALIEIRLIKVVEISDLAITLRGACPMFLQDLWKLRQTRALNLREDDEDGPPSAESGQGNEFFDPHATRGRTPLSGELHENDS